MTNGSAPFRGPPPTPSSLGWAASTFRVARWIISFQPQEQFTARDGQRVRLVGLHSKLPLDFVDGPGALGLAGWRRGQQASSVPFGVGVVLEECSATPAHEGSSTSSAASTSLAASIVSPGTCGVAFIGGEACLLEDHPVPPMDSDPRISWRYSATGARRPSDPVDTDEAVLDGNIAIGGKPLSCRRLSATMVQTSR